MRTGKLLYIPDGTYVKYRGITTINRVVIYDLLNCLIFTEDIITYPNFLLGLGLPVRGNFLESEFEVIEDE